MSAEFAASEISGAANHHAVVMYQGGPDPHTAYSVQDKVSHAARETTLYLPGRTLSAKELRDYIEKPGVKAETVLGHSINAASLSRVNYELLVRIAEKLGVDTTGIR